MRSSPMLFYYLPKRPRYRMFQHMIVGYRALHEAKKARHLSPICWRGHFHITTACAALNKHEKAITSYECALAPDPINTQIQKTLFESQLVHGRQLRQEHLDPRFQPKNNA
ncbi:unnamed protein product [Adineta ricciae]|uniref:Uncharacterized protein n=1 Tax=Adineta ricciae TaxID=249248 RepID=A0A815LIM5_ADIRI|nr:unnamed protein product [Adineta ricciae]